MQFAIIENNIVVNVAVAEEPLADNWIASDVAAIGDTYQNGQFIKPQPPQSSPEEIQNEIVQATQQRLDAFARTRNYDGISTACTYATSTMTKFAADGRYAVNARDATWSKLYEILSEVDAGTRPAPTSFTDIEPELPALCWPDLDDSVPSQFEKDQSRYTKRAAVKDELMAYMAADNMSRVRAGTWTVADLTSLIADPAVATANQFMSTLSFELAAQAIASASTPLLTPAIRADWIARLEAAFFNEG